MSSGREAPSHFIFAPRQLRKSSIGPFPQDVAVTALGLKDTPVPVERVTIEKVTVNPKLDDANFTKPVVTPTPAAKPPVVVTPKTK